MPWLGKASLAWSAHTMLISASYAFSALGTNFKPTGYLLMVLTLFMLTPSTGWSAHSYAKNEAMPLLVDKVVSNNNPIQYRHADLPFVCPPSRTNSLENSYLTGRVTPLSLDGVFRGDMPVVSTVNLTMMRNSNCTLLCTRRVSSERVSQAKRLVRDGYFVQWTVDGLPGATSLVTADSRRRYYSAGFKIGHVETRAGQQRFFLHNHFTIVIRYRDAVQDAGRKVVVSFEVYPKSLGPGPGSGHVQQQEGETCQTNPKLAHSGFELKDQPADHNGTLVSIPYTYSVYFRKDNTVEWERRWDPYYVNLEERRDAHWLAVAASVSICLVLAVVMVFARPKACLVMHDIDASTSPSHGMPWQGGKEQTRQDGSKFAKPGRNQVCAHLAAPLICAGTQLLLIVITSIFFGSLGFLDPSLPGRFVFVELGLVFSTALLSASLTARVSRASRETRTLRHLAVSMVAVLPGLAFAFASSLNLFVWSRTSSVAMPHGYVVLVVCLWFCFQGPAVYVGLLIGCPDADAQLSPSCVLTGEVHAQIDLLDSSPATNLRFRAHRSLLGCGGKGLWRSTQLATTSLAAGLPPFALIYADLLAVCPLPWHRDNASVGSLLPAGNPTHRVPLLRVCLSIALLLLAVSEASILAVRFHPRTKPRRVQSVRWRGFLAGAGSAVWLFGYCARGYLSDAEVDGLVPAALFLGFCALACCAFGLLAGAIGFWSAHFAHFVARSSGSDS